MSSNKVFTLLGVYGLWILLLVLWTLAAFQVQSLVLYLGILVIQNDTLKPAGWSGDTLSGISRCSFLILASIWLGMAIFTEKYLREGATEQHLRQRSLRLGLIGGGIYLLSTGLLYLIS